MVDWEKNEKKTFPEKEEILQQPELRTYFV